MPATKLNPKRGSGQSGKEGYSAVQMAEFIGVSDKTIGKWGARIKAIWYWRLEELIVNPDAKSTVWKESAIEAFKDYQLNCGAQIPKISDGGKVCLGTNGKIIFQNNPNYVKWQDYRDRIWEQFNRQEVVEENVISAEIVPVEVSAELVHQNEEFSDGLVQVGGRRSMLSRLVKIAATQDARGIVGDYEEAFLPEFQQGMERVDNSIKKAFGHG